jgi:uncharacterized protein YhaN
MRLSRLHLERYGPFTDVELRFRPGARLHVVYGPNEAGKSCALAAVTDLLFGIEHRTAYNFLHDNREMRIGARIADRAGNELGLTRRKGNRDTLLDSETGAPVAAETLASLLGGVTRDVFQQAFGLNSETLRSGAQEMLAADGDVGTTLFAAASGLRGLTDLRRRLDAEAEAIFAVHRSGKRTFYQALDRFEEARKAVRERELRANDWKALNDEIERLAGEIEDIKRRQLEARTDHARLARLGRVAPQIARIDDLVGKLDGLGPLPAVLPGFAEELERSLRARDEAAREEKRATEHEALAERACAAIVTNGDLLARANEIEALVADLGAYTRAMKDLPGVEREIEIIDSELTDLAVRLGLPDAQALVQRRPADTALALVRELLAEGNRLRDQQAANTRELDRMREALAGLERESGAEEPPRDPKPFEERLDALKPALRRLERHDDQRAAVERLERQLAEAMDQLSPRWTGTVEHLAVATFPAPETIEDFRGTFQDCEQRLKRLDDRLDDAATARRTLERRLAEVAQDRPVPTSEAITASRLARETIWQRLHAMLFEPPGTRPIADIARASAEYARAVADADLLMDEALREATRVAEHAGLKRQLGESDAETALLQHERQQLRDRLAVHRSSYTALWREASIAEPHEPARMLRWLESVADLLRLRQEAASAQDELGALDRTAAWARPLMDDLAAELGVGHTDCMPLGDVAEAARLKLRRLDAAWREHCDRDIRKGTTREHLEEYERRALTLMERQSDWTRRWPPAVQAIGLEDATLAQAEAALDVWQVVPGKLETRGNRAGRVTAMRSHNAAFAAKVAALVDAALPDLAAVSIEEAVKQASARMAQVREQAARKADAEQRLAAAAEACTSARTDRVAAEQQVARLSSRLPPTEDLAALCRQLALREELTVALAQHRLQLAEQADGLAEADIRAQLAARDPDRARADLRQLEELQTRLEEDAREKYAAWKAALARRAAFEQGVGAEEAAMQQRSAEASLALHTRDWCVLKIAALLLGSAIEHQRSSQHDPLMARAGALFALLSGGSFDGLVQELDEDDVPRLVGRRPSGRTLHVKAMSEGARDQLYLALRLAYLEDFASRSEPPPFIGDDLFMTFDDDRARCGISALAGLSDSLQPIIFTHHRHLVDVARDTLGDGLDELRLG